MDATQRILCGDDLFNPVLSMGLQASLILSISHLLQIAAKPFGVPSPIAQITAGLLIGHSALSKIPLLESYFYQSSSADYYEVMAFFGRISVVFLIGLELDLSFAKQHLRSVTVVAYAAALPCVISAGAISYKTFENFAMVETNQGQHVNKYQHFVAFIFVLVLVIANSASPLVVRFIAELKLSTSDFGRLAICSSLVNDITCVLFGALLIRAVDPEGFKFFKWVFTFIVTGVASFMIRRLALWLNRWNPDSQYIKNAQVLLVFLIVLLTACAADQWGQNSILASFILGVTFPRQGKTARTMMHKLSYAVYTFVLPIYFGYTGFQANFADALELHNLVGIVVILVLSFGGKILGTLAACHRLKIPMKQGIVLALLLNLKGHFDILILGRTKAKAGWSGSIYEIMLITAVLNSLVSGLAVAYIVMKDRKTFGYCPVPIETQNPETETHVLACVSGPRHVPTMVKLIGALSWSRDLPISAYLMHLVELLPKKRTSKMYHQLEDDELSDDESYGGNDAVEINNIVDSFTAETGINIHQVKAVSPLTSIYEDVCNYAEDIRASLIILSFHKLQRIDGKLENSKESIRTTNQRVLRHAPCTVAILVDRGLVGASQIMQHVAALFFGGPDDREALSLSKHFVLRVGINLTVIRFVQASSREKNQERINVSSKENEQVLMAMPSRGTEDEADNAFLEDFYNRFVTSGQVGYVEKYMKNGAQTAAALRDIADTYQLFVVGNGGRRHSLMTIGMSDWEECPELGTVGDLLASSEFDMSGSVLIVQQHRPFID